MNNNKTDLKAYLMSEYGATSSAFLVDNSHDKNILKVFKAIRNLLIKERDALTIQPSSSAYLYFRDEYKDHISFERNNIIVPNTSDISLRLKR